MSTYTYAQCCASSLDILDCAIANTALRFCMGLTALELACALLDDVKVVYGGVCLCDRSLHPAQNIFNAQVNTA